MPHNLVYSPSPPPTHHTPSCTPLPPPAWHSRQRFWRDAAVKQGPAILIQDVSTVVVEPGCTATVSPFGDVAIDVGDVAAEGDDGGGGGGGGRKRVKRELDPVYLSIFAHRFMGIAEQMGRTLQVRHGVDIDASDVPVCLGCDWMAGAGVKRASRV